MPIAAQRPPLPRQIRATQMSLEELVRQVATANDDARRFLKFLAEQEYDVTKVQARILRRASLRA